MSEKPHLPVVDDEPDEHGLIVIAMLSKPIIHEAQETLLEGLTVAEGVQDRQTWDLLSGLGCKLAQGFFIAKPIPAVQLLEWIKQYQK